MLILSIESSCDETAAAVTLDGRTALADEIFSQVDLHKIYGGVVPEIASRKHIELVDHLADSALKTAGISKSDIDAVAVTYAPGLIGALLVGVNFAKSAAFGLDKPLIPVHHIRGHIAANYIAYPELEPPFLCLVVSGGHSLIAGVDGYTDFRIIGTTRDDAAGECFDKVARILGLGYPGGPPLDKLAQTAVSDTMFTLPVSKIEGREFDCSFSGLKTTVVNLVHNAEQKGETLAKAELASAFSKAVSDALIPRTIEAAKRFGYGKVAVAGGVAANSRIRADLEIACLDNGLTLYRPPLKLCADNAAMIGCQGYYEFLAGNVAKTDLNAVASLPLSTKW
ncbi:MAG: tRNA (adenosine(37)-N6)-threonylcarbamoyltransferase complex transferase subunit TsaD [Oscillospiraceae bacterium]|nr:tRNA (adenosine(37)-N6)-threonylcarbamoyltransferase complex transferase subunit TsaD [Oscillospiraceae bacterium]